MVIRESAASSSSSNSFPSHGWTYDVFLSFRGEDTRFGFTSNLYHALREKGIHTFFDEEEIRRGQEITPALLKAIQGSKIAIVVFSHNYASSAFCLLQLVHILQISSAQGLLVWPVFYDVDPSHVRHQRGSYAKALAKHEDRLMYEKEKVQKWRLALHQAANFSGWHFKLEEYEYDFIERIVKGVSSMICRTYLNIAKYPVGIDVRVLQVVKSLIDVESNDKVNKIGIYGIGGIGKSTIARALYNMIAPKFEFACFLADVRENSIKYGPVKLQEILLFDLAREKDIKLEDVNQGIPILERRLCGKKVLVILDNVDKIEQLEAIAGAFNWFGLGSTIIITTRDKQLLRLFGVKKINKVKELNFYKSLELLSWKAFGKSSQIDPAYMEVMNCVVQYSQGLPLALKVIGSNLFGKSIGKWKSALDLYRKVPNKEVQQILKISYDCLEEGEQEIFLDIACFYKGKELKYVMHMVELAHDLNPTYVVEVLIDKSLIEIEDDIVTMHDLIQDMGREIVRQKSREAGKRSRLWSYENILYVLEENTGTDEISIMIQDSSSKHMKVNWNGKAFKNMKNLKILILENAWFSEDIKYLPNSLRMLKWLRYPSSSLPLDFHPRKLVLCELSNSCLHLIEPVKRMENLGVLNISKCQYVTQIPDLSNIPNLKELWLEFCKNLIEIHDSVGYLEKLEIFNAVGCYQLKTFPCGIKLPSLKRLDLWGCSSLKYFPEILEMMEYINNLNLDDTAIEELPFSICNLTGLKSLHTKGLERLELPSSIAMLPELKSKYAESCGKLQSPKKREGQEEVRLMLCLKLETVYLRGCKILDELLFMDLTWFTTVKALDLTGGRFTILPASIKFCHSLLKLLLNKCTHLREVREIPPNIQRLEAFGCTSLSSESRNFLLNQEFREAGNKLFLVPGARIPEWFDHFSRGPFISFWFCNKFPTISISAVPKSKYSHAYGESRLGRYVKVYINGYEVYNSFVENMFAPNHITVNYLRVDLRRPILDLVLREGEWNHVKIFTYTDITKAVVAESGINVVKKDCSTDDIRFSHPSQSLDDNLIQDSCPICDQAITGPLTEVEGEAFVTSMKEKESNLNRKRKLEEDDNLARSPTSTASRCKKKGRSYSMNQDEKDKNKTYIQSSNASDTISNQGYNINNGCEWLSLGDHDVPMLSLSGYAVDTVSNQGYNTDDYDWLCLHPFWQAPLDDGSSSHQEIFQQHSTSINLEQTPEHSKNVKKTKGKEIIVFNDNNSDTITEQRYNIDHHDWLSPLPSFQAGLNFHQS